MAMVYSTEDVHPRDAVSYWVEVVTRSFVKYALTLRDKAPFRASVRTCPLAGLTVYDYQCDPHGVGCSATDISESDNDDVFVFLQLSGRTTASQDDRQAVIERGGILFIDPQRPFAGRYGEGGRLLSVRMPRQDLQARTGNAAALSCRALDGSGPVAGLAFGFLTMLSDRLDGLDDTAAAKIADQGLDLVALAFAKEFKTNGVTLSSPRAMALMVLKGAIESRLHDPELKPAVAAAAAGISVRYANALLAQEGTCLERYIIGRRLERCRRALEDPGQAHRLIGEIAFSWGFSDLSHFIRRFKAAFGSAPGEYRKHLQCASAP